MNQSDDRKAQDLRDSVEALVGSQSTQARYHAAWDDGAIRLMVEQPAYTFEVGDPVVCSDGTWLAAQSYYISREANPLWGVVSRKAGPNRFQVIISGEARVPGASFTPGRFYGLVNGAFQELFTTQYPPAGYSAHYIAAKATAVDRILVVNDSRIDGLQSQGGTFTTVTHADITDSGMLVVWSGVPSGESPLALADEANSWKWTNVGIALFEVDGAAHTWLVLTGGSAFWSMTVGTDPRPAWLTSPPYNINRPYLSDTNPGRYAASEPEFKVFVGRVDASWTPASEENPAYYYLTAHAVLQGSVYPIPASGGGTGTNLDDVDENSIIAIKTVGGKKKLYGYLNAGPAAFLTQDLAGVPTWTYPELGAGKSFELAGGVLYARVCGKQTSETEPTTTNDLLKYDGTKWSPFFLLDALGRIISHDGTSYVQVDASTPKSVLGVAGSSAAIPAPIQSSAANQIFSSTATSVGWLTAPTTSGQVLTFNGTSIAWADSAIPTFGLSTQHVAAGAGTSAFTVPAGVYRVFLFAIGAGGGHGARPSNTAIGNTTTGVTLYTRYHRQQGGSGGYFFGWVDVTPGQVISYTVGAAGTDGTLGGTGGSTNGGDTTVTIAGSTYTAGGGQAGYDWAGGTNAGRGGTASGSGPKYFTFVSGLSSPTADRYVGDLNNSGVDGVNPFMGVFGGTAGRASEDGGLFIMT